MNLRSLLYKAASILGDINAVRRGTVVKHVIRKQTYKTTSKWLDKLLK